MSNRFIDGLARIAKEAGMEKPRVIAWPPRWMLMDGATLDEDGFAIKVAEFHNAVDCLNRIGTVAKEYVQQKAAAR